MRALSLTQTPAAEKGPYPTPQCGGSASPHSCLGLSTPPPAGEGRREGKRNPPGASGAQPLRSPGVWFQLGGQIPGSQASAGGRGDGGTQSRAQNEEAPGIWPGEEAPIGQGTGPRGLLGKKPSLRRGWRSRVESQFTVTNLQCTVRVVEKIVRCLAHSRLLWAQ